MSYRKDGNGDGMVGVLYYLGGHVTLTKPLRHRISSTLTALGAAFVTLVVLGAILYIKPALEALETVIAG